MEPVNDKVLKFGPVLFVPPLLPKGHPTLLFIAMILKTVRAWQSQEVGRGDSGQDTDCESCAGDGGTLLLELCLFLSVFKGTPTQQRAQN